MLSDSQRVKDEEYSEPPNRPKFVPTNIRWSDQQKIDAVTTYIILGNLKQTATTVGIPHETLRQWKVANWWKDLYNELKEQENLVLSQRLKKVIEKTLAVVEDRLESGDHVYDSRRGEMVRKPVSMKDAHIVGKDLIQAQQKLTAPVEQNMQEEGIREKLEKLAKSFEEFAQKQLEKPKVQVTDVIFAEEQLNDTQNPRGGNSP